MLGLSKCYSDITSSQLSREQILQYWPRPGLYGGHDSHEGLDLWSLLDGDVLNWLGGEDKRGRRLLLAAQEVRLIIEAAAAALAAARVTGGRPDSFDGWFEDNLANHAATARAIEEGDSDKRRHGAGPRFQRSLLYRRKAGAGRRNGRPSGSRSLRKN